MKASEIRKLSAKELDAKLLELKDELFKLRFQQAINQLDNPMRINAVKKDIARIIKLAKNSYHIEIIPNGIEEYNLWEKLCTNSFRGSDRHYGLM